MKKERLKKWLKFIKEHEHRVSLFFGILVFALLAGLTILIGLEVNEFVADRESRTATPTTTIVTNENLPLVTELPDAQKFYKIDDQYFVEGLPVRYIVQSGDSTWKVAEAFYRSGENYRDIESENGLSANASLEVGQEIVIPDVPTRLEIDQLLSPTPAFSPTPSSIPLTITSTPTPTSSPERTHTVRPGEGLWQIAQRYYNDGNRYVDIYEANRDRMKNPEDIRVGMELRIPQ